MTAHHLAPAETAGILAAVARKAAADSGCAHPDDIACQMAAAIDAAAVTLDVLHTRGVVEW